MTPRRMLLLIISVLWAKPLTAQDGFITPGDQARWNAVGRVSTAALDGTATCTGTLIADDLVLTAAHCVARLANADAQSVAKLAFLAGLNGEDHAAIAQAHAVILPPHYQPGTLTPATIYNDLALIRLADPITSVQPMPVGGLMAFDDSVGFIGYVNALPRAPMLQTGCDVVGQSAGLIAIDCMVVSGNSGAPLLAGLPDAPRVVGVISAKSSHGAYAAALPGWIFNVLSDAGR